MKSSDKIPAPGSDPQLFFDKVVFAMGNESGEWIMHGLAPDAPGCLHTPEELIAYVESVGFLPLFANGIAGFSVEEHVEAAHWWSGDESRDPWEWRRLIARSGRLAYGKFFDRKAGFISREWLPFFVNHRRDGYDFDARWDDEKASWRQKKIMDLFTDDTELFSYELKEAAGFGKGGEKNFEGVVTDLQGELYLCVRDFRQKLNRLGQPYGWHVAVYCKPEHLWGYEHLASAYREDPARSRKKIFARMRELYPDAPEKLIRKI